MPYLLLLLSLGCSACHWVLPLAAIEPDGLPRTDSPTVDGPPTPDSEPDLAPDTLHNLCKVSASNDTMALFTFDNDSGTTITDLSGYGHQGTLIGGASLQAGTLCGTALALAGVLTNSHARIDDSPQLGLPEGSIDLTVTFTQHLSTWAQGILSRDASGAQPGELTLFWSCEKKIVAHVDDGFGAGQTICSDIVRENDGWHHVGVNFGPGGLELWVDHQPAGSAGIVKYGQGCVNSLTCDSGSYTGGIDGVSHPWIVGAHQMSTSAALPTVEEPMVGLIDNLRISRARLDFSKNVPNP